MKYGKTKINPGWIAAGAVLVAAATTAAATPGQPPVNPPPDTWNPKYHAQDYLVKNDETEFIRVFAVDIPGRLYLAHVQYSNGSYTDRVYYGASYLEDTSIFHLVGTWY